MASKLKRPRWGAIRPDLDRALREALARQKAEQEAEREKAWAGRERGTGGVGAGASTCGSMSEPGQQFIETLPATIKVCGYDINIVKWTAQEAQAAHRYGEWSSVEQTIRVQLNMPTRFKAVDTVLHEISHAIFWAYGVEDEDKQERIVGTLGTAWTQVYRDNPWLLKWLQTALA